LQRLLLDELNHRVKNTLATIQAIATQSLRHAKSTGDFVSGFSGRLHALARAHDLLLADNLRGADVAEIVREQVLVGGDEDERIKCSGPSLLLGSQTSLHLALVLHELATNARKYGALSDPNGRLSVQWEVRTNGARSLVVEWNETGRQNIRAPRRRGFGSALIERTLRAHGGKASSRYASDGLRMKITLPLADEGLEPESSRMSQEKTVTGLLPSLPSERTLESKRVLVVEDEPLVSMELESNLTDAGCEVAGAAGNFAEAKLLCSDVHCDAALLDANLAGHRVDELAVILTQRGIPFAFVTGYAREALPQGFQHAMILKKPFTQKDLVRVLGLLVHGAADVVPLRRKSIPLTF
jgi:two-component sensor histidine kinase/CheY-like chemotaxis protein